MDSPKNSHDNAKQVQKNSALSPGDKQTKNIKRNHGDLHDETDLTFKVLKRCSGNYVIMNSWKPFPEIRKPLDFNFDVKFCINLKTAFSELSQSITTY